MSATPEAILFALLRASLLMALTAAVVAVLLRGQRISSPRIHRAAAVIVLLQGWLIFPLTLSIPWYDPQAATPASDVDPPDFAIRGGMAGEDVHRELPDTANASINRVMLHAADRKPAAQADWLRGVALQGALGLWLAGILGILFATCWRYMRFVRSVRDTTHSGEVWQNEWLELLRGRGIRRSIPLRVTPNTGPMLCLLPSGYLVLVPMRFWSVANREQRISILRHELSHYHRGDVWKSWLTIVLASIHWFNPAAWWAVRRFRQTGEWLADRASAETAVARIEYLRALQRLVEMPSRSTTIAAHGAHSHPLVTRIRRLTETAFEEEQSMNRVVFSIVCVLLLLASLVRVELVAKAADEPSTRADAKADTETQSAPLKTTADPLPRGLVGFNGMLIGRLAAKDAEKGTFLVSVDAVPRVWRNSKAEDPKSVVGKTVEITGVFGRFLDVLVVTRSGDTVEFECKHDGERLVFPGELLRKVAAYDPSDYPELPEAFRGFQGAVAATILKKDAETFEMIVQVDRITDTWKNNRAKDPTSIQGRRLMLAGFWNRKDAYHGLKVGDKIEVGMQHVESRSDHLNVAEIVRKAGAQSPRDAAPSGDDKPSPRETRSAGGLSKELQGFRGMLVGRLVEKDIERGTFTIAVDAVPRVWNNNKSSRPKAFIGSQVKAEGVTGKMLDALVVTRPGETLEFGALHDGGERMRVGEVLRKVAPVQPGDYPVLPDDFRGFRGFLTAKVIRKDDHLLDLVVEVTGIQSALPDSRAKSAESIIGQRATLAGFWQRKDAFHSIGVGDSIECGVDHPQRLNDHLTVIESINKVESK